MKIFVLLALAAAAALVAADDDLAARVQAHFRANLNQPAREYSGATIGPRLLGLGPDCLPSSDFHVDISAAVPPSDISQCVNSPKPDLENGQRVAGNGRFAFDVHYDSPEAGKDYYMPLAIGPNAMRRAGQYYAYYGEWGYTGYQPDGHSDDGRPRLQLIYSSFSALASVVDTEHCRSGADGDAHGVSCSIKYTPLEYDRIYYIRSVYDEDTRIFTGYFIDPYNRQAIQIGSFRYSQPVNWQMRHSEGFLESYSSRNRFESCCSLDSADVLIVGPLGEGMSSSNPVADEYGSTCSGRYADLKSVFTNVSITIFGQRYQAPAIYYHRGWLLATE